MCRNIFLHEPDNLKAWQVTLDVRELATLIYEYNLKAVEVSYVIVYILGYTRWSEKCKVEERAR